MTYEFGTWYPIESAPRDGTDILVGNRYSVAICFWSDFIGECWQPRNASFSAFPASHWMPLPAPPVEEK